MEPWPMVFSSSGPLNPETDESQIFNPAPDGEISSPLKTSQNHTSSHELSGLTQNASANSPNFIDEIQALKLKILELEKQARAGPVDSMPGTQLPPLVDETNRVRRMEETLYRHRSEWETKDVVENYPNVSFGLHGPGTPKHWDSTQFTRIRDLEDSNFLGDKYYDEYRTELRRLCDSFQWRMGKIADQQAERRLRVLMQTHDEHEHDRSVADGKMPRRDEDKESTSDDSDGEDGVSSPKFAEPRMNLVDWVTFKQLGKVDQKSACVIDVLLGEPVLRPGRPAISTPRMQKTNLMSRGQAPLPERIRLRSSAVIAIMAKILDSDGLELEKIKHMPVIFIRPFKTLFYCEQGLRDWCAMLERKFSKEVVKTGDDLSTGGDSTMDAQEDDQASTKPKDQDSTEHSRIATGEEQSATYDPAAATSRNESEQHEDADDNDEDQEQDDPNDITKSPTALEHLKCVLNFMDSYVSEKRAHLQSPLCRRVYFSDLWYLFRPGMEVIDSDGKQAYRVIEVASQGHNVPLSSMSLYDYYRGPIDRSFEEADKKTASAAFSLTCVHIDFNGKNLGPVVRTFNFKGFSGERDITSFEVYPLRFHTLSRTDFSEAEWRELKMHPKDERYRKNLIRRGAKFLEVAAIKHMYYAGPTLVAREEVESQVVIDFETAFTTEDGSKQHLQRPKLEALLGNPTSEETDEKKTNECCLAPCCQNELVHDHTFIDKKERIEYTDSLLPKARTLDVPPVAVLPQSFKELQTEWGNFPHGVLSDDDLVIMSYRVFGFVLRNRKWAQLDVSLLTDVHPPDVLAPAAGGGQSQGGKNKDNEKTNVPKIAFDRLVLERGHREMIVSLITQHFRDKEAKGAQVEQLDIVRGKGKGLILLLHGAPGVGKTSTAEGVAEMFKKPLFQITCGDLGTTAKDVERTLEMNFMLANRWGCILLLDEADVFLAERTKEDFKRNGLVAAFLRVLEYYAGILFLTTNRVGDFDEAFTSRIHMSLYYPELDLKKTIDVFILNFSIIKERFAIKKRRIEINEAGIVSFATEHFTVYPHARWNGRQIRNACQTALALAEFEAQGNSHVAKPDPEAVVKLTVENFNTVRNAYLEFTKYMKELYGTSAARRAKESKLRADMESIAQGESFAFASQRNPFHGGHHQSPQGYAAMPQQQGVQQSQGLQQQSPLGIQRQHSHQHSIFVAPQPSHGDQAQAMFHGQQFPNSLSGNYQIANHGASFNQGSPRGEGQSPFMPRVSPSPSLQQQQQQQQQQVPNRTWFGQGIRDMYETSDS